VTSDEVMDAIRNLGGAATAAQVLGKLGATDRKSEVEVLVIMGRLLSKGALERFSYKGGDVSYHIVNW
jgi:predicted transcriptional regulator